VGVWKTALPRSFVDERRGKTLVQIIITEGSHPYVTDTRL